MLQVRPLPLPCITAATALLLIACGDAPEPGPPRMEPKTAEVARVQPEPSWRRYPRPRSLAALDESLRRHYPVELRGSGRRGSVLLDVSVDARGRVTEVEVVAPVAGSVGGKPIRVRAVLLERDPRTGAVVEHEFEPEYDPVFGPAAQAAIRATGFLPALRDGRPVPATVRMGVEFAPGTTT